MYLAVETEEITPPGPLPAPPGWPHVRADRAPRPLPAPPREAVGPLPARATTTPRRGTSVCTAGPRLQGRTPAPLYPPPPRSCSLSTPASSTSSPQAPIHIHERKVLLHLSSEEEKVVVAPCRWVLDTGATNHMTGSRCLFAELDTVVTGTVRFGDGSVVDIKGKGAILFALKSGEHRRLDGVYYIPRLMTNIVSLEQMDEEGLKVIIEEGVLRLFNLQRRLLAKVYRSPSQLYLLDMNIAASVCLTARVGDVAWRWHERYSHLNFQALRKLEREEMVCGLPSIDRVDQVCEDCILAKQKRAPFPQAAKYRAQEELELVHGDLCGPISPPTPTGNAYFLLLVDDMSRFMWLTLLRSKADALVAIMSFQARVERECGKKLKVLRTDNGGEFTSVQFGEHCAGEGIQRHFSTSYTPQQNGVV
jgi:transposase InsO family protein